jgi:hypothetical protein
MNVDVSVLIIHPKGLAFSILEILDENSRRNHIVGGFRVGLFNWITHPVKILLISGDENQDGIIASVAGNAVTPALDFPDEECRTVCYAHVVSPDVRVNPFSGV